MGLLGKLVSNDGMAGFKRFDNSQGWSNADILEKLSGVTTTLGEPRMGAIKIMGKDVEAVVYDGVSENVDVYIKSDDKKINIGSAPKPGAMGAAFGGGSDADTSKVNRAIEELQGVMDNLLAGREVRETKAAARIDYGDSVKLYMEEKLEISLKDRYTLFTADHEPAYFVEGNAMDTAYKIMDAQKNEIMVIKKKLIAVMPEYTVYEAKSVFFLVGHFCGFRVCVLHRRVLDGLRVQWPHGRYLCQGQAHRAPHALCDTLCGRRLYRVVGRL